MTLSSGTGTLVGTVTLDIGTGAGNGTATYTNLRIDTSGSKQLTASASGFTSAISNSFTVSPAAAAKVVFGTQPTNTTAGTAISPAVTARIEDQFNNLVNSGANVTVSIHGAGAPTLHGTTTQGASGGVATFNDLSIDAAGTYQLDAA